MPAQLLCMHTLKGIICCRCIKAGANHATIGAASPTTVQSEPRLLSCCTIPLLLLRMLHYCSRAILSLVPGGLVDPVHPSYFSCAYQPPCRWQPQIKALNAAGYRTIAPDLPGLGQSDKPADLAAYSFQTAVTPAMVELVNSLKLEKFSVVGHDFGAGLAWGLGFMCPDKVERVVVLSVGYMGECIYLCQSRTLKRSARRVLTAAGWLDTCPSYAVQSSHAHQCMHCKAAMRMSTGAPAQAHQHMRISTCASAHAHQHVHISTANNGVLCSNCAHPQTPLAWNITNSCVMDMCNAIVLHPLHPT
jgi:hypothetical protein